MIQQTIQALAEPRRREILALVHEQELTSSAIETHFDITAPAVSQHLKVLYDSGLVAVRREGTKRFYRLRREGLTDIKAYIDGVWDDALLRLKAAAEEEERQREN
ncbi:ArsR/SmtB family transcription factor [Paenibacillus arenilitoris]|uniref:Winged helix-turn-helix transcriptional regulator n=1 Tax=Paenibacillus arenilitoris TaxID=2772299 RepID=A0A927H8T7_9BACL|nr:metalloregulator ArsR/SmtB family transcription factor [Paenibacillus arenilitoris]MBD2872405.1 winged helix-turn-helix transcriptional regulator [Paenibacillus arenilitoris]